MRNQITSILTFLFICNCSSLQLSKYDGFWEWFKGKPGYHNAFGIRTDIPVKGKILTERHPFYLWLRTPEILFNPQEGAYYPDMIVEYKGIIYYTNNLSDITDEKLKWHILTRRNSLFNALETGIIDMIVPYRELNDPSGITDAAIFQCIVLPIYLPFFSYIPEKIIFYPIHDVIKTVMLPVAAVYYTIKVFDDSGEEEPEE